ncbi:catecholate siderophore receptor Fiu [Novosphingobium album (ex Hu et al. 2023)]|uniref:Catecholate siderophore receptor Fiu n=1 Tax=Novosphingobium album (ex Hu et al. 2023) TaxID=2930093 RepID=A0ABT0B027_9SPHN|nr:catecholate siderophore receptor Fiu [Novosphingobium album (ex Hu et al. 2023)]MCJ2178299.1 catecholate siderophore receptor Fiu [Novosphingobium album (ex Hu et al. 2023)]
MSLSRLRESLASTTPAYLALSCFGLAATPALAQEAASTEKPAQLGGVTVTDTAIDDTVKVDTVSSPKFTQPLQDTPQTIQVISKDLFNQQGATTLTEALRNSPGVGTFYAGENGNTTTGDAIRMRGFDTSSSIFVDGIRDLGSISRDVFNTEQVEVAKGPAGTDNGRTAPTGAINMVSKQPFLDTAVSGTASIGVDGQKRATADFNQVIDAIPNAAVRLNVLWQDSDDPARDHVKNKRIGIAPSLGLGLGTQTRLYLNFLYVDQENIPDGYVPTIGLPGWEPQSGLEALIGNPVDSSNFYGTRDDHDDVTAQMGTIKFEHEFSDSVRLTNTARWGKTSQDYLLTSFMSTSTNVTATDPDDLSTYTLARSLSTYRDVTNRILTDQLNLQVDFNTGAVEHNLSTGIEITSEKQILHAHGSTGERPAANLYDPDWNDVGTLSDFRSGAVTRGKTDTQAFYLFDTAKFFDGALLVTGGIRVDHYKTTYFSNAVCNDGTGRGAVSCGGAAVGTIVTTNDLNSKDTLFNWKLGAVFKPVDTLSLYVNYALSQQPPGGDNFTLSSSASNANNPVFDPQKAETFEAGVKWSALGDMLALNAAVFQTTVKNEINSDILDDAGNPTQTGEKRVRGFELSAVGNITEAWSVSAGYSHLKTKVTEGPVITSDGTPNLTYIPGDSWTVWTNYRFPFGLEIAGGARHNGGLHRGTDGAVGTPAYTAGYTVVDGMLGFALTDQVKLRVNAYNLFDKEYVASINKSGYRYTPGTPRTFLFSADFNF